MKHLALAVLIDPTQAMARGLMGLVAYRGRWQQPSAVAEKVKADEALAAALAEYNGRRERTPNTADAQWKLGLWCEENGLKGEAQAHFATVIRLEPAREAAWKRLGYKKENGRWVSEAQVAAEKAEVEAQKQADQHWKPLLTKWRSWLGDKARAAAAERGAGAGTRPPRGAGGHGDLRQGRRGPPGGRGSGLRPDRRGGGIPRPGDAGPLRQIAGGPAEGDRDSQTARCSRERRASGCHAPRPDQIHGAPGQRARAPRVSSLSRASEPTFGGLYNAPAGTGDSD